jgi:MFS family permease
MTSSADTNLDVPVVVSPYEGKTLTTSDQIAISAYWFATNFHWGALLTIMLPFEVERMSPVFRAESLGVLTGASAIMALVAPLIAGALSDRCASRWGRRRPYMALGIAINVIGLLLMAASLSVSKPVENPASLTAAIFGNPGLLLYFVSYLVVQLGNNVTSAAYMGVIPDLVPHEQRGKASGFMALKSQAGTLFGAVGVGLLLGDASEWVKYLTLCAVLVGVGAITLFGMKETPLPFKPKKLEWGPYFRSLWIDPKKYPDFAWVWITRALVMLGFYAVLPFINYYLVDVVGIPRAEVGKTAPMLLGVILIASSISGVLGGSISDKVGRKRVVYVSNMVIAIVTIAFIFCHNIVAALAVGTVFGLAYGAYISVDYALGTDVLPSRANAAKEMAVWHIAMTLPQSIAAPASGFLIAAFGKTIIPATKGVEASVQYPLAGYAAVFILCSVSFALGAVLLKNVKGVK